MRIGIEQRKEFQHVNIFIENTTFDYVWVGSDDLHFDVDAIDPMLVDFENQFDTNKDIVLKGHNVDF